MSGVKGNKPHKKVHKGCIGWVYCNRLDKTLDIGDQAAIPDKKGYMCDCGRYTRLDPFKHEINYYDDDNKGIDYEELLKLTSEIINSFPLRDVTILYWETPMGKPKHRKATMRVNIEITKLANKEGWYAWNVFNEKGKQIITGSKEEAIILLEAMDKRN